MVQLTQEQLLLLEQLTYLDTGGVDEGKKRVYDAAGANSSFEKQRNNSLGEIFASYDTDKLRNTPGGTTDMDPTYAEWADIIDAIRSDSDLANLTLTDERLTSGDATLAYVYVDANSPEDAIVTFRGTTGAEEWKDDVYSGGVSDTPIQENALNFVEELPYNNITATGHSKGGNKAQYVALLSDKVTRCVSFDGEGFSDAFLEKYGSEIEKNAYKLECYASEYDYVHELMNEIPGAKYYYIKGQRRDNFAVYHAPHTMMAFLYNEDGIPVLVFQYVESETKEVQMLRDLADYLLYATQKSGDWEILDPLLEDIIAIMLSGDPKYGKGVEGVLEYILNSEERQEALGLLLSYICAYIRDSEMTYGEFYQLLHYFGVPLWLQAIIVALLKENTDGEYDPKLMDLAGIANLIGNDPRYAAAIRTIWQSAESNYGKQPVRSPSSWRTPPTVNGGTIYDFTNIRYEQVMASITQQNSASFPDFQAEWGKYSSHLWYSSLFVGTIIRYFSDFCTGLQELNEDCRAKLEVVFSDAEYCDNRFSALLIPSTEKLRNQKQLFTDILESIHL